MKYDLMLHYSDFETKCKLSVKPHFENCIMSTNTPYVTMIGRFLKFYSRHQIERKRMHDLNVSFVVGLMLGSPAKVTEHCIAIK